MPTNTSTISGSSHIFSVRTRDISGQSTVTVTAQDILTAAKIVVKQFKDLIVEALYSVPGLTDKRAEILSVLQPIPAAPSSLTATDLATGDSIRLDWPSSGAPGYNVYKSTGGPFVKVNSIPLAPGETSYIVGGLTTGVPVTFHVKGVNGEGTESAPSPTATATPTLDVSQSKFTSPTWQVKINGTPDPAISLDDVRLGYGSDFSRATFRKFEQVPSISEGSNVEVIVNGRSIFKGKVRVIASSISASGLQVVYTALSNIVDLTDRIVKQNKLSEASYNTREDLVININSLTGTTNILGKVNLPSILSDILGYVPEGTPDEFPGEVVITDQTVLQAVETSIRNIGNWRIYFNHNTDRIELYQLGKGGKFQRVLDPKLIIDSNITTSSQDVVKSITIRSAPVRIFTFKFLPPFAELVFRTNANGELVESTQVGGLNIGDVTVEAIQNRPPEVTFDSRFSAAPIHAGFTDGLWPGGFDSVGNPLPKQDAGLRPSITKIRRFKPDWSNLSAEVRYTSNVATIFFNTIPRIWDIETLPVSVPDSSGGRMRFNVLKTFTFRRGSIRVHYSFDSAPLSVTVGGGDGKSDREITDLSYRPVVSPGLSTVNLTLADMQKRAQAELDRLGKSKVTGSITILGDETVDLRTVVNGLEVISVTHSFTNGFTTRIDLSREIATSGFIPDPLLSLLPSVIPNENRLRPTRTIVDEQQLDILFIDRRGNSNRVTPRSGEIPSDVRIPDSPHAIWRG